MEDRKCPHVHFLSPTCTHVNYYINAKTPKSSSKIFKPIKIKIIPPINSALFWNLSPNLNPIKTPILDKKKVIIPIKIDEKITFTS